MAELTGRALIASRCAKFFKNDDKNKILMHKDLAEKNNLKVGDKIKIKSNLFDADNENKVAKSQIRDYNKNYCSMVTEIN